MAIQVRRGNEADFDASKMLPGEWAVSLDTQYVRMCFAPGIVLRMATYEGFENEKAQIQSILAECQSIQSAVERIQAEVNAKASLTIEYSNSAKESADKAYEDAERAKTYASNAEAVTGVNIATKNRAGLVKGGDNHIAEDGTLMLIKDATSTTLSDSYSGRINFNKIIGAMEQGENPSPTNPQEIRNVEISGIRTHRKNFADFQNAQNRDRSKFTYTTETAQKIVATRNADAGAFVARYSVNLKANITYKISLIENVYQVYLYYDELWGNVWKTFSNSNDIAITPPKDGVYIVGIYVPKTFTSEITISNFMIREDGTDATYEPYTESLITFSQPIDIYGLDDVRDVIEDGVIKRRFIKKSNITFSLASGYKVGNSELFGYRVSDGANKSFIMSNVFPSKTSNELLNNDVTGAYQYYNYIYARIQGVSDVDEFNSLIANNVFVYEMAEETTEELPLVDQIALNSLPTYAGITHVEFISDVQPTFKGEYGTSKIGGMTLESLLTARSNDLRLSAVESAVINNI